MHSWAQVDWGQGLDIRGGCDCRIAWGRGAPFEFPLRYGQYFSAALPCMPANLLLDVWHSMFYLVRCWMFQHSVNIPALLWDTVKLHGNFDPCFLSFIRWDQSCLNLGLIFPIIEVRPF